MEHNIRLLFDSSIDEIKDVNESFSSGIVRICYPGLNRNGSMISKDSIERARPTMFNCPVVCNYDMESNSIGGHDIDIVRADDGDLHIVNLTSAVGVVPANANTWWETVSDNGIERDYFTTDIILWKRSPAYQKIKEDGIVSQSMEITVKSGKMEDGVFVIDDFIFTAFCLLGDGVEPCFESASLRTFDRDCVNSQFSIMMKEFKESFQKVSTSDEVDIHPQNYSEGGEKQLNQKIELLAKFGLTAEQVDFDIENMSLEDLEAKLQNGPNDDSGEKPDKFALSGEQFREGLVTALQAEKVNTEWGEMSRYAYCDYDAGKQEVFCYDVEDWNLYGFTYSMNGDHVVIDFACRKRKKFSIVDFEEGDAEFSCRHMFETVASASASNKAAELTERFNEDNAALQEKYNAVSDAIKQMNNELDELRSYKRQKISDERAAEVDAVFAMFTDLNGIEAFENLRKNCSELSIEELEDKCYALRGRHSVTQTFSAQKQQQKAPRLPIEKGKPADEPYGGLFVEFPPNR